MEAPWRTVWGRFPAWGSFSERRFRTFFGVSFLVCTALHNLILRDGNMLPPEHFLMMLYFLKCYPLDSVGAAHFGVCDATFRHAVLSSMLALIDSINLISPRHRFDHVAPGNAYMSVDTTPCPLQINVSDWAYQKPFYSEHDGMHCLKYEIGIQIWTGQLVWVAGPYFGSASDLTIVRNSGFLNLLGARECAYADKIYVGEPSLLIPFRGRDWQLSHEQWIWNDFHRRLRVRVENAIGRIKHFHCLRIPWRHKISQHVIAFWCCAQIAAIDLILHPVRADPEAEWAE